MAQAAGNNGEEGREILVSGRYLVDLSRKQPDLSGCAAYPAEDMAGGGASWLALAPTCPSPRLSELLSLRHRALMPLHDEEYQAGALWLMTSLPLRPSLAEEIGVWSESEVVDGFIRPFADLLRVLGEAGVTCRCIRPDNLFVGRGRHNLVLGPIGVAPPAEGQPVLFEPLSSAVCAPSARGAGTIAGDVFSLGVVALALCLGRLPLAGLSDQEILERRFAMGSAAAYLEGETLPDGLVSVLRAMLSDRESSRPSPADLATLVPGKVFTLRPEMPARAPLVIGGAEVRTPRALAWYAGRFPDEFLSLLQRQVVGEWLRRELDQVVMAGRVEQVAAAFLPGRANRAMDSAASVLTHAVAVLDPDAAMFRAGLWFWPDAIPLMIARLAPGGGNAGDSAKVRGVATFLANSAEAVDLISTPTRQAAEIKALAALARRSGASGAEQLRRLPYDVNSFQICLSPRCAEARLSLPEGLLTWLDAHVGEKDVPDDDLARTGFLDEQARAFLEACCARRNLVPLAPSEKAGLPLWMVDLRILAAAQKRFGPATLPAVARRALPLLQGALDRWRSKVSREKRRDRLTQRAEGGDLSALLAVIDDPSALRQDKRLARQAEAEVELLQRVLDAEPAQSDAFDRRARDAGEFFSLLLGIAAAMASVWLEFTE